MDAVLETGAEVFADAAGGAFADADGAAELLDGAGGCPQPATPIDINIIPVAILAVTLVICPSTGRLVSPASEVNNLSPATGRGRPGAARL